MMSRKSYNASHGTFFPAQRRSSWRRKKEHKTGTGRLGIEFVAATQRSVVARASFVSFWDMSDFRLRHIDSLRCAGSAPRCAAALPVRSIVLRWVGGVSWGTNQQHGGGDRPASNGEHLFPTVHHKTATPSRLRPARSGRARRQQSLPIARTSLSAAPNSGYPVTETRRSTRSWSSWTKCARASGLERGVSWQLTQSPTVALTNTPQPFAAASPISQPASLPASVSPAMDAANTGRCSLPGAVAATTIPWLAAIGATALASCKATSPRRHRCANRFSSLLAAIESRAKATKGKAGTAVVTGHVRRSTAGTGLRVGEAGAAQSATSEFMDVTAGETALISIPATALGMRGDGPQPGALPLNFSTAGVDTPSIRDASLEGRGPVEDWTDGCLAARAVIYPARRGASYRAFRFDRRAA